MITAPEVKVGQIWQDYDSRFRGRETARLVCVMEIVDVPKPYAKVVVSYNDGMNWWPRVWRIRLDRFKPNSTGYQLVGNVGTYSIGRHREDI